MTKVHHFTRHAILVCTAIAVSRDAAFFANNRCKNKKIFIIGKWVVGFDLFRPAEHKSDHIFSNWWRYFWFKPQNLKKGRYTFIKMNKHVVIALSPEIRVSWLQFGLWLGWYSHLWHWIIDWHFARGRGRGLWYKKTGRAMILIDVENESIWFLP